jgi:transposase
MKTGINIQDEATTVPKETYDALAMELVHTKHELEQLKRMIFGSKSERFIPAKDPNQLDLGFEDEKTQPDTQQGSIAVNRTHKKQKKEKGHSRLPLPDHLPRQEYIIEPEGDMKGARKIGEEVTEILEYIPGTLIVKRYIRPKYVMPDETLVIAELPSLPIPRGNAGPGLLAHILVGKFVDHLPFYRQVQQLKRQNITVAESTINDWFSASCRLLVPLYDCLKQTTMDSDYLMADETPIPVLTSDKPNATHKGYHWVYFSPLQKSVFFDYRKGRGREGPEDIFENYQGAIQTDGYAAYNIFDTKKGITLLACMAHARRKFDQALENDPDRANYALSKIQELYRIEKEACDGDLSFEQRKELRNEKAVSVLDELENWMKKELPHVLPKSAIGKAITYTLGLWKRLRRYVDDGRYEIDNNLVENSIRPVAIGRKNYMFAGSHEGASRAAMIYSFLGTCKKNEVNPFEWLKDVLSRIQDQKANKLNELLPQNWTPKAE